MFKFHCFSSTNVKWLKNGKEIPMPQSFQTGSIDRTIHWIKKSATVKDSGQYKCLGQVSQDEWFEDLGVLYVVTNQLTYSK